MPKNIDYVPADTTSIRISTQTARELRLLAVQKNLRISDMVDTLLSSAIPTNIQKLANRKKMRL